jgi:hypothetical protein
MPLDPKVASAISGAAQRYGLAMAYPGFMERMAGIESGGNPQAYNPSGAAGLFQFMPKTAAGYGLVDPYDPVAASDAAARLTLDNAAVLRRSLGREPTAGELYLAHQQGAGGASKMLANPDTPAASLVGAKAVTQNGGSAGETAAQFAGRWTGKFDGSGPTMTMPGESVPSARAPFSLSGPVGSSAPAPTIPDASAKADSGPDLGAIMKMLGAGQSAAAPAATEATPLPAPAPAPAPRPQAFDARKFFALLPSRR